jgi:hypothetical protein
MNKRLKQFKTQKLHLKMNFYFSVLVITVTLISERCEQLKVHNAYFSLLYDTHGLSRKDYDIKLKFYKNLQDKLTDSARWDGDICAVDLIEVLESRMTPFHILEYIFTRDLIVFPNVYIALRILLTIPVTAAAGERLFSKLK